MAFRVLNLLANFSVSHMETDANFPLQITHTHTPGKIFGLFERVYVIEGAPVDKKRPSWVNQWGHLGHAEARCQEKTPFRCLRNQLWSRHAGKSSESK